MGRGEGRIRMLALPESRRDACPTISVGGWVALVRCHPGCRRPGPDCPASCPAPAAYQRAHAGYRPQAPGCAQGKERLRVPGGKALLAWQTVEDTPGTCR